MPNEDQHVEMSFIVAILATVLLGVMLVGPKASSREVGLVPLDSNQNREIAKGQRAEALKLKTVANDKGELIGRTDLHHPPPDGSRFLTAVKVAAPDRCYVSQS